MNRCLGNVCTRVALLCLLAGAHLIVSAAAQDETQNVESDSAVETEDELDVPEDSLSGTFDDSRVARRVAAVFRALAEGTRQRREQG